MRKSSKSRAFSYSRFSTIEQAAGDSQRRQDTNRDRYLTEKGLTLDTTLTMRDRGVSAFRGKNRMKGALAAFLTACQQGHVNEGDVLIVEDVDRLSRQEPLDGLDLIKEIVKTHGVTLVTLTDRQEYTRESLRTNPSQLFILLGKCIRAHEESATKSMRVAEAWSEKRKNISTMKVTTKSPSWIRWSDALNDFELDPTKVGQLRRMVKMAIDGVGPYQMTSLFNRDGTKPISKRGKKWEFSAVKTILSSRALIGEFQPGRMIDGRSQPTGETIKNYYPAAISEEDWYRLQHASTQRKTYVKGRTGTRGSVANLFGGRLFHGLDGGPMQISRKREGDVRLFSLLTMQGLSATHSFPYPAFETNFLRWVSEVDLTHQTSDDSLAGVLEDQLSVLRSKIDQIEQAMDDADDADGQTFTRLVDKLKKYASEEATLAANLEDEKAKQHERPVDTREIKRLLPDLLNLSAEERDTVRSKLKQSIAAVCQRITIWTTGNTQRRIAYCVVDLVSGQKRTLVIVFERLKGATSFSDGKVFTQETQIDGQAIIEVLDRQNSVVEIQHTARLAYDDIPNAAEPTKAEMKKLQRLAKAS